MNAMTLHAPQGKAQPARPKIDLLTHTYVRSKQNIKARQFFFCFEKIAKQAKFHAEAPT